MLQNPCHELFFVCFQPTETPTVKQSSSAKEPTDSPTAKAAEKEAPSTVKQVNDSGVGVLTVAGWCK